MDEVVAFIAPTFLDHAMPPAYALGPCGIPPGARDQPARALADVAIEIEDAVGCGEQLRRGDGDHPRNADRPL